MSGCDCESKAEALADGQDAVRRRTLWLVLAINLLMFVGEATAGLLAHSQALLADAADNLGDALVYAMSLFVLGRALRWRAGAAMVKGLIQLAYGAAVMASIVASLLGEHQPVGAVMTAVAAVALLGNLTCLGLLMKHRGEDINMRSVWLCSRNDVIGNVAVIGSGAAVLVLDAAWPDLVIASLMAAVFLQTACSVLRDALHSWRRKGAVELA
jgi:Co/Zn/Cd efflux system component